MYIHGRFRVEILLGPDVAKAWIVGGLQHTCGRGVGSGKVTDEVKMLAGTGGYAE